ncbi:MAG: DUF4041 domain-containing protein [Clostridia bacterium]|nr:DUF4041 domain-containing protein [Clostridia bacterium]
MGFFDIFRISKIKAENERLSTELADAKKMLTPEMLDACKLEQHIRDLEQHEIAIHKQIEEKNAEIAKIQSNIDSRKKTLVDIDEQLLYQDFALYKPKYDFVNSDEYKERLDKIRSKQKDLIKNDRAVSGNMNWQVNGSKSEGKKMVKDMQKLLLRAFNSECDEVINRVTYANIDLSEKRINTSYEAVSKLGRIMSVSITSEYLKAKIEELYLAFEYKQKKQEEKEAQKELRAQLREEQKLQKEIEEARKKVQKEQKHYQNALETILKQIESASEEQKAELLQKKLELENQLGEIDKNLQDIDYREANAKAGYVYIISNIGAFGEDIYKIGMTRRLDPQERIDELGDASVPFDFDIHAMIFSEDAPALEAALHKAFENKKLNMVNHRREFFNVSLDEIKSVIRDNFDKVVEFVDVPEAEQYRTSIKLKENL